MRGHTHLEKCRDNDYVGVPDTIFDRSWFCGTGRYVALFRCYIRPHFEAAARSFCSATSKVNNTARLWSIMARDCGDTYFAWGFNDIRWMTVFCRFQF